jgi:hypothetical protein
MPAAKDAEIGRLEGRIEELIKELADERRFITEMRQQVEKANEHVDSSRSLIENWIEAFETVPVTAVPLCPTGSRPSRSAQPPAHRLWDKLWVNSSRTSGDCVDRAFGFFALIGVG